MLSRGAKKGANVCIFLVLILTTCVPDACSKTVPDPAANEGTKGTKGVPKPPPKSKTNSNDGNIAFDAIFFGLRKAWDGGIYVGTKTGRSYNHAKYAHWTISEKIESIIRWSCTTNAATGVTSGLFGGPLGISAGLISSIEIQVRYMFAIHTDAPIFDTSYAIDSFPFDV